jgi:transposase
MALVEADSAAAEDEGVKPRRRRRRWSDDEKRRIVAACREPGVSVSEVARRFDVNANQVFTWRRQFAEEGPAFVPVVVFDDVEPPPSLATEPPPAAVPPAAAEVNGRMEIVLEGGSRIIIDRTVSAAALSRVLGVLERRPVCRSLGED